MKNYKHGVRVYASIPPELYKRLKVAAKAKKVSMAQIIGLGVQRVLNKK